MYSGDGSRYSAIDDESFSSRGHQSPLYQQLSIRNMADTDIASRPVILQLLWYSKFHRAHTQPPAYHNTVPRIHNRQTEHGNGGPAERL